VSLDQLQLLIQGLLAAILCAGAVVLATLEASRGQSLDLPGWLTAALGVVIGHFFGTLRRINGKNL
jgi:uncharacterized membrane protein